MLQQLDAIYRAIGFSFARALNLEPSRSLRVWFEHWYTGRCWTVREILYDFSAVYSLATIDGGVGSLPSRITKFPGIESALPGSSRSIPRATSGPQDHRPPNGRRW